MVGEIGEIGSGGGEIWAAYGSGGMFSSTRMLTHGGSVLAIFIGGSVRVCPQPPGDFYGRLPASPDMMLL